MNNQEGYKPDELAHYGVLGMKWGVRRGASAVSVAKATSKAQKKMLRLDKIADRKQVKATKRKYSPFRSEKSAARAQRKANRKAYKASEWYRKSEKILGTKTMESLKNSSGVKVGEKYANWRLNEMGMGQNRVDPFKLY